MKKTDKPTDETLDAERARRVEQLATIEAEASAVDAEMQAIESEREPLTLKSLDSPDAEGALIALEERNIKATARKRSLAAKGAALRKEISALDAEIRKRDFRADLVAPREDKAALIALAKECDMISETLAEKLGRYEAGADALQRRLRALGVTHTNRLRDRDSAPGSVMRHLDPRREIAPQIHPRYRRPLSEQAADGAPAWAFEDRDPPEGWCATTTTQAPPPDASAREPETEAIAEAVA